MKGFGCPGGVCPWEWYSEDSEVVRWTCDGSEINCSGPSGRKGNSGSGGNPPGGGVIDLEWGGGAWDLLLWNRP